MRRKDLITAALAAAVLLSTACSSGTGSSVESTVSTTGTAAETTSVTEETAAEESVTETEAVTAEETSSVPEETEESVAEATNEAEKTELSAITWDTDLMKYTNATAYKTEDGDITVDLDGDGVDEVLNFTHFNDSDEAKEHTDNASTGILPVTPYINGEPAQILAKSENDFVLFDEYSFSMPSGYVYICDIMEGDGFKEICFVPFCYTDDYTTLFVRYDGEKLVYLGEIGYDTPDPSKEDVEESYRIGDMNITWGRPMVIDGSGEILAATRLSYQTWFGYTRYIIGESGEIEELANTEVYPYGIENKNDYDAVWNKVKSNWSMAESESDCMLTKELTVYAQPSFNAEFFLMSPQPAIPTGEIFVSDGHYVTSVYDDFEEARKSTWVYVTAKDGTSGWFNAYPYEETSGLFSVMTEYD
ncbi:MAG: hypothetical protein J6F31_03760 [Oscillospiraceae bacterium]|nr:hypothetical protein [Oscillospiraceae bacterium]